MATNTPLQSVLITSSTSTIVFSNIDQNYTDLVLVVSAKVDSGLDIWLRCNGDSGSNYGYTLLTGDGTTASSARGANASEGLLADWYGVPKPTFGHILTFTLNNYSNTTTYKTSLARSNRADSGLDIVSATWRNTNAITNLTLRASNGSRTFDAGTTVDLYGIKSGAQKAFGGNTVTTDGNYWYHTFKTSGTFLLQQPTSVDYLVVAGGGGGNAYGSGGGAGGLRSTVTATGGGGSLESALLMSPGSHTVIVGAGGSAGSTSPANSSNGSNSVFSTITSTGGGGVLTSTGQTGGSGGGSNFVSAGYGNGNGGAGTAGQGFAGGASQDLAMYPGGGGGGAGAVGTTGTYGNPSGTVGGAGGVGIATSISGSSVYYAGGGGGGLWYNTGGYASNTGGAGGNGGGGRGPAGAGVHDAQSGTANTGGGGGGSGSSSGSAGALQQSGNGGSGIVIVRYAV